MPRYICKYKEKYFEWSTVVDAVVTKLMTIDEFKEYYQTEYGKRSMDGLEERLIRVEEKGTSAIFSDSIYDLIDKKTLESL